VAGKRPDDSAKTVVGGRPADDQHPLGYGREADFWALIAALA